MSPEDDQVYVDMMVYTPIDTTDNQTMQRRYIDREVGEYYNIYC